MNKLNIFAIVFISGSKAINFAGLEKSSNKLTQLSSTCGTSFADGFCGGVGGCGVYGNNCGNIQGGYGRCGGYPGRPFSNNYC